MNCPRCQIDNPAESSLCKGCGQTLRPQPVCFDCQHVNALDRKFCSKCGSPLIQSIYQIIPPSAGRPSLMTEESNKAVVTKIIDGLNRGNLHVIDEYMTPSFVRHSADSPDMGREGFKQLLAGAGVGSPKAAFQSIIDGIVCDGNNVAFRCTHRVTHAVPIMGVPPTGKRLIIKETFFSRFENGKIAEWWTMSDASAIQRQLGAAQ